MFCFVLQIPDDYTLCTPYQKILATVATDVRSVPDLNSTNY